MNKNYRYDYIIAGAGILGSAIAYSLSERLSGAGVCRKIAVLDIDLEGEYSSTLKNAGGVRSTWRNRANIELCSYSISFYEKIREVIGFRQKGYFWMHNEKSWNEIMNNRGKYEEYGLDVGFYHRKDVQKYLPFVDNLDDISGLSVSRDAGLVDHYSLREYYRRNARERGVEFIDRKYVTNLEISGSGIESVIAKDITGLPGTAGKEKIREILKGKKVDEALPGIRYKCDQFINAAGAWADRLLTSEISATGMDIRPRRRQMVVVDCPDINLREYGMIIDTSDVYFHGEGEYILLGYSDPEEPYGTDFRFDFYGLGEGSPFIEKMWKPLWRRISRFTSLKFIRGWSGMYGETSDRSGYMGKIEGLDNAYECCGHTGRGLMISYGAGQVMSDIIIDGRPREELSSAADLSRSRPNGPLYEQLHL